MENEITAPNGEIIDTGLVIGEKIAEETEATTQAEHGGEDFYKHATEDAEQGIAHNAQTEDDSACESAAETEKITQNGEECVDTERQRLLSELETERKRRAFSENKLACMEMLTAHELPIALSDYLTGESVEETRKRVEQVSKIVKALVGNEVSRRLVAMPTPTKSAPAMSSAEFQSLSLSDMQRLYSTDKELYRELTRKNQR